MTSGSSPRRLAETAHARPIGPAPAIRASSMEDLDQVTQDEPDVGRALREAPHVPGEPGRPVTDQHLHPLALTGEAALQVGPDAVEQVDLVRAGCRFELLGPHP